MIGSLRAKQDHDRELAELPPLGTEAEIRSRARAAVAVLICYCPRGGCLVSLSVLDGLHCLREQHKQSIARERAWNKDHPHG